jgi:hypothetical protein
MQSSIEQYFVYDTALRRAAYGSGMNSAPIF